MCIFQFLVKIELNQTKEKKNYFIFTNSFHQLVFCKLFPKGLYFNTKSANGYFIGRKLTY